MGCVYSFLPPSSIPWYSCVTIWWLVSYTGSVGLSLQLLSFREEPFQHSWADFCGKRGFFFGFSEMMHRAVGTVTHGSWEVSVFVFVCFFLNS